MIFSKKNCWQSLFSLVKCKSTSQITIHSLKRRVNFDDLQKRVLIGEKGQGSEKLKMASENKLLISKQFRLSTRYHVHQVNKDLDKRWDIKNQLYFEKGGTANHSPFTSKMLVKGFLLGITTTGAKRQSRWWTVQDDRRASCVICTKVFLRFSPQSNPVEKNYDWCKERAAIICDYSMLEGVGTLVCLILKINENQFKMNRNKKAVI